VAKSRLAQIQGIVAHLGLWVFVPGIAVAILTDHGIEQLVMIGSLLVLLGAVLFIPLIWQATARR
jgi:purine-cytosine permease-like protein